MASPSGPSFGPEGSLSVQRSWAAAALAARMIGGGGGPSFGQRQKRTCRPGGPALGGSRKREA